MAGKALSPELLERRGSYIRHPERRPAPDRQPAPVVRLAEERVEVAEPAPATIKHPRGVALWDEIVKRLMAQGTMTRDALRVLERLALLNVSLWHQAEIGRPIRAAVAREIGGLELQLGIAKPLPGTPMPKSLAASKAPRPENRFARFRREIAPPTIEQSRQAAADALQLVEQLRRQRRKKIRQKPA